MFSLKRGMDPQVNICFRKRLQGVTDNKVKLMSDFVDQRLKDESVEEVGFLKSGEPDERRYLASSSTAESKFFTLS